MKVLLVIILLYASNIWGQQMTPEKLVSIIEQEADTVNRMRIISPIVKREKLKEEELSNALMANFHAVLDVKYALSDEIIWS